MATEIVLIGSNVDRERSVSQILRALLDLTSPVHISRIVETPPVGLVDGGSAFLNVAAAMPWDADTGALKARLIDIEVALGRNRSDRGCSVKSRTADIDPLLRVDANTRSVDAAALPTEPYARELVVEVLAHIGVSVDERQTSLLPAVEIPWGGTRLGRQPTTLRRTAGLNA